MNEVAKISIIVPIYNEKRYLNSCVESILNQTYKNIEVVLVDDGSDDETARNCDYLATLDSRIKVIHKENGGLSAARITGLENSSGQWITFVDNDDLVAKNMLESFARFIDEDDFNIIAGGRIDSENESDFIVDDNLGNYYSEEGKVIVEKIPTDRQKTIITPLWGKIYRKSFLDKIDLLKYKEKCPVIFFEDVLMTPLLFYQAKKMCIIEKPFYFHREVASSISRSGKITNFYYNQIYSGDILLDFFRESECKKYYSYQLSIYFDSIIRIYSLMDKKDKQFLKNTRNEIRRLIKKHKKDYFKKSDAKKSNRIMTRMFIAFPKLTGILLKKLYFKR